MFIMRYLYIICAIFVAFLSGCRDIYKDDGYLFLSVSHCLFGPESDKRYLEVTSSGDFEIDYAEIPEWCSLSIDYGDICIAVAPNTGNEIRSFSCLVRLSGNMEISDSLIVTQAPGTASEIHLSYEEDEYVFDATGGIFCLSIRTNGEWKADLTSDYYSLDVDSNSGTLVVKAPVNETTDSHSDVLSITSCVEGVTYSESISLKQLTKSESPYYSFVGNWDLYCSQWVLSGEKITGGTYTSCQIVEDVVGESYVIKGLFYQSEDGEVNTLIPALFNPETKQMEIAVGNEVGLYLYGMFPVYLMMCNLDSGLLMYDKLLVCTSSEDGNRIDIDGFETGYGWGCFLYMSDEYQVLEGMPYAVGNDSYLQRNNSIQSRRAIGVQRENATLFNYKKENV